MTYLPWALFAGMAVVIGIGYYRFRAQLAELRATVAEYKNAASERDRQERDRALTALSNRQTDEATHDEDEAEAATASGADAAADFLNAAIMHTHSGSTRDGPAKPVPPATKTPAARYIGGFGRN